MNPFKYIFLNCFQFYELTCLPALKLVVLLRPHLLEEVLVQFL